MRYSNNKTCLWMNFYFRKQLPDAPDFISGFIPCVMIRHKQLALRTSPRSIESARGAVDIAKEFFPEVECKWCDAGIDDIIEDASINAVLVVLAA
ncbi:hypothetical protein ACS0TY_001665 [Phlomoides rotata]